MSPAPSRQITTLYDAGFERLKLKAAVWSAEVAWSATIVAIVQRQRNLRAAHQMPPRHVRHNAADTGVARPGQRRLPGRLRFVAARARQAGLIPACCRTTDSARAKPVPHRQCHRLHHRPGQRRRTACGCARRSPASSRAIARDVVNARIASSGSPFARSTRASDFSCAEGLTRLDAKQKQTAQFCTSDIHAR